VKIKAILSHYLPNATLFFIALIGMGLVLYATTWGPVLFSDSVGYLDVAKNILSGKGVGTYNASGQFSASTIQPPFFSIMLAFLGLTGLNLVTQIRWLHAAFWCITILLIELGIIRLTGSKLIALAGALSLVVSPLFLHLFCTVMTEPLFILLSVSAALCLLHALEGDHLGWLAIASLCVGFSAVIRLVGVSWIVSGVVVILIFWPGKWKRRLWALFCYGGMSSLPFIVWFVWVQWIVKAPSRISTTGTHLAQRLIEARLSIVNILWRWLPFSDSLPDIHYRIKMLGLLTLAGLSAGGVILALWLANRKSLSHSRIKWLQEPLIHSASLLWLSFFAYLGVNLFGYTFTNPIPDLNERTLSMGLLIGIILTFMTCAAVYRVVIFSPWRHVLPLLCAGVLIAATLPQSLKMLEDYHREGYGYLGLRWRHSSTRLETMELPADIPLISNENSMLAFWLDRPVYPLPEVVHLKPEPFDVPFGERTDDEIQQVFRQRGAALVVFDTIRWQLDVLYFEHTPERLDGMLNGLRVYGDYNDGAIYFYPTTKQ
jgi:4-amino-4-deoxy-L-arabinose transferase-like glycosyltransferase